MPISTDLIKELKHEATNTRKILERVPTDKLDWRPHEKSMTIGRLATHLAEIPIWINRTIDADEFDFAKTTPNYASKESTEAILQVFDERLADAVKRLEGASDENLNGLWSLKRGEQTFFTVPRKVNIRNFAFNHAYHHRGQLSVYLRLLDVAVPGMYGPSADER